MSRSRRVEQSVLFDAPGPHTKRLIMVANIVGGGIITAILVAVAIKLQQMGQLSWSMWQITTQPDSWLYSFLPGLGATLLAALVSIVGAFIFGLLFGVARLANNIVIRWVAAVIVEFCRAVPVLLMMIFMNMLFGSQGLSNTPFWAVVVSLILYNGSVCAELVRSGVINLPVGQHEAASAIGLTRGQALANVLVPQALLSMLPALIAQLIVALKDSALGSAIAYSELLREATLLGTPYRTLQTIFIASVIFILINYGLGKLGEWLASKMRGRGLQLDDNMAEEIPINVSATGAREMLEDPDPQGPYVESERKRQEMTGQRRHL